MYDVMFAENVSIESLNPHNFSLKNEYIDNIISTAWLLIPKIAAQHDGISITKGFLSRAFMAQNIKTDGYEYLNRHSEGLAIELTWRGFETNDATNLALDLIDTVIEPLYIIIDTNSKRMGIYRKTLTGKSEVVQLVDTTKRVVKTVSL